MKARVKATGEIVEGQTIVEDMYVEKFGEMSGRVFHITDLDFDNLDYPGYWTRLEHQYAGMAMQGLILTASKHMGTDQEVAQWAKEYAHALVEKLKNE